MSGFYSPTNKNTTTEAAATNNFYTQVEQTGDSTDNVVKNCPEFASLFTSEGAGSAWQGCRIRDMGDCETSTADYCHDGTDFMCPVGMLKSTTASGLEGTLKWCEACADG